jgi:hypothetical protein
MADLNSHIAVALGAMESAGPRKLLAYLRQPGPDFEPASEAEVSHMTSLLLSDDPNEPSRLRFSQLLRSWDNEKDAVWTGTTTRNTADRRKLIHAKLEAGNALAARIDRLLPFFPLDEPIIIADAHQEWYRPVNGVREYYWKTYLQYLRERRHWPEESLLNLNNSTRAVVECLSDPEAKKAYSSRGLVMGYVQSGKTANFIGVAARAADAGYRLLIILAGTWNILRNQTQRRFDKELLGRQLLANDETYTATPPEDWDEFLSHKVDPASAGHYTWQRLTRPDIDFKALKSAIDVLEFQKKNKSAPLYDPSNLHEMPVKLLVIKKHSGVLKALARDLKAISSKLTEIPTLIIDDESDQAGINTVDPKKADKGKKERTETNAAIVNLLGLFPRGQYVGYTATPYANALVNADDEKDIFPKDFIVSLDRPAGYMGVSDFFDPYTAYTDLDPDDFFEAGNCLYPACIRSH